MKIKTFEKLNNALCYSNFEWSKINPPTVPNNQGIQVPLTSPFGKVNILFGENGNGKSKLVDLLKCVNDSADVPKHHDLEAHPQEIKIKLDGLSDLEYVATWNHSDLEQKFLFFDKGFISSTVHSLGPEAGDTAQRKQQRGRDIIYLGNFEQYNSEIEWIDSLRSELRKRNSSQFTQIEALLEAQIAPTVFERAEVVAEFQKVTANGVERSSLTSTLTQVREQITKLDTSIKETANLLKLEPLTEIALDSSLTQASKPTTAALDSKELFEFSLADAIGETLQKIENKKDFVRSGVKLLEHDDKLCPFCTQSVAGEPAATTIKTYKEIFNEKFAETESENIRQLQNYKEVLTRAIGLSVPAQNNNRLKELANYATPATTLEEPKLEEDDRNILEAEIQLCLHKIATPLQKIEDPSTEKIEGILKKEGTVIHAYNASVRTLNDQITALKKEASEGSLSQRRNRLEEHAKSAELQLFLIDNRISLERYCEAAKSKEQNQLVLDQLDRIFSLSKTRIVEEFKTFANDYFALIATYVSRISPAMAFLDIQGSPTYDGRSTTDPAQCGFKVSYNQNDISGQLSEGERQVIALAFFFAQLTKDPDKNKIIVLDDPITSFDAGKRKATAEVIKEVSDSFQQLFVFTCDPLFRQYLLKSFDNRNFYYVLKTAGCSAIHYAPKHKEAIFKTFEDEFLTIDMQPGTDENIVVFGQKLRFCLETRIRENYFGASEDSLDAMLNQVANDLNKYNNLMANKAKIIEIYSYCNTGGLAHYPKDGATSWNELKAKVGEYLNLNLL